MKFRLLISYRITFAFILLLLGIMTAGNFTNSIVSKNLSYNRSVKNIFMPSTNLLQNLKMMISDSKLLIKNWVFVDKQENTPEKIKLRALHKVEYPQLMKNIQVLSHKWERDDKTEFLEVSVMIDSLFNLQKEVMEELKIFEDYENPMKIFTVITMVEQGGSIVELNDRIEKRLEILIEKHNTKVDVANSKLEIEFGKMQKTIIAISIVLSVAIVIVGFFTLRGIIVPISYLKKQIDYLSKGGIPETMLKEGGDEIGNMTKALNRMIEGLKIKEQFAHQIGNENFDAQYSPLSEYDELGNALLLMQKNLKNADLEEQKRRHDDKIRAWSSEGANKMSELIRENHDEIDDFTFKITQSLTQYLAVNQGLIYLIDEAETDEKYLKLASAYAYGKRRMLKNKLLYNEGLIGRCFLEKETIYLNDIPESYVKITSGLGEATPTSLLLVPLKGENEVLGVLELGSFSNFQKYEIEFVERIAEMIGTAVKNIYSNAKTNRLLKESREKSEQLEITEQLNRQNIEAMERDKRMLENQLVQIEEQYKSLISELEDKIRQLNIEIHYEREDCARKINSLKNQM